MVVCSNLRRPGHVGAASAARNINWLISEGYTPPIRAMARVSLIIAINPEIFHLNTRNKYKQNQAIAFSFFHHVPELTTSSNPTNGGGKI